MDKAYDHENSEVLVCKLRRANNGDGGKARGGGGGSEHLATEGGGEVAATGDGPATSSAACAGAEGAKGEAKREEGGVGASDGGGPGGGKKADSHDGAPGSGVEGGTGDGGGGHGCLARDGCAADEVYKLTNGVSPIATPETVEAAAAAVARAATSDEADGLSLDAVCLVSSSSVAQPRETLGVHERVQGREREGGGLSTAVEGGKAATKHDR